MTVRPFAIDGNGKQVSHEVINALYHPNKSDSLCSVVEKIAVSTLSLRKIYFGMEQLWLSSKPGGDFI